MDVNQIYEVESLSDYIIKIKQFSKDNNILWYRGHEKQEYMLLPNLYRKTVVDFADGKCYNSVHLAEDMRIQQYYAQNYSFIRDNGVNTTEWLGMSQHFGMKTRFLDWSTSAIHALMFALENYGAKPEDEKTDIPCVWILKPQEMNKKIVENIMENVQKLRGVVSQITRESNEINAFHKLIDELSEDKDKYKYIYAESNPVNDWKQMDYIYDLAYFDRLLEKVKENPAFAFTGDMVNPIFYFLGLVYINGYIIDIDMLKYTPLAIVHPLNSDRIKNQRGVFTIFPFPEKELYDVNKLEYLGMEYNPYTTGNLCKIILKKPEYMYQELKCIGVDKSWLYYEPDIIIEGIECR